MAQMTIRMRLDLLVGEENRLTVRLKWPLRYVTYQQGARLIADVRPTAPQITADARNDR